MSWADMSVDDRYIPTCRQFTGQAWRFRAYVLDRTTGCVVAACDHRHRTTKQRDQYTSGEAHAMRCADRLARSVRRTAARP